MPGLLHREQRSQDASTAAVVKRCELYNLAQHTGQRKLSSMLRSLPWISS
jgi:hypothetical protein